MILLCLLLSSPVSSSLFQNDILSKLKKGIESDTVVYRLTEPEEIESLLGPPTQKIEKKDGGMDGLVLVYPEISLAFWKMRDYPAPFTLHELKYRDETIDIGQSRQLTLRSNNDLKKVDRFWGFADISLVRLDLRQERKTVDMMSYDTLTEWPDKSRLPDDFDPVFLMENSMSPGLQVRSLHKEGIDGRGVGIAVIDQPLLLGHKEYTNRIERYDATGLSSMQPQMHGAPVASIAVGKNIGVAPGSSLTYFAVPMWEKSNLPYIRSLERIFEINRTAHDGEKIKVVSISTGTFSRNQHYDNWQETLARAEENGILVVTCDPEFLDYGILTLMPGKDPDDFHNYTAGQYSQDTDVIAVPGANRAVASHRGTEVYTFDRMGGMSWGAPYIAGLAALAYQVDPKIPPGEIIPLLVETATQTESASIVNPRAFITRIRGK